MRLFIAEKASLGKAIAENLSGPRTRGDGFIECGNGDVVTWASGHLYELAGPEYYANGANTFDIKSLPIFPEEWVILPKLNNSRNGKKSTSRSDAERHLRIISDLLKKASSVVHAGDPDREGEAIVRNILEKSGNRKPVDRLWLSALDPASVKKALSSMKPDSDPIYTGMYSAALARSRADWMVGYNLTPAITHAAGKSGYRGTISIGRVQTPTLSLVVTRDLEIDNFKPKDYYVVRAEISVAAGIFVARYKAPDGMQGLDSDGRIASRGVADTIASRVGGATGRIGKFETRRESEPPPLPYALSSLQIHASSALGMGAQKVLDVCQSLYESHQLTSYPRTDCEYLPESQQPDGQSILSNLSSWMKTAAGANPALKSRAFNDKKITAHHAIVPTGKRANMSALTKDEAAIYEMICARYIAQFYPDYVYDKTSVEALFGQDRFTASGRIEVSPGWRSALPAQGRKKEDDESVIPAMRKDDSCLAVKCLVDAMKTTPPASFTEGTLIEAMTNVHKFVTDPEARKRLREVAGIGTEATRAGMIEKLLRNGLLVKEGKKIRSSGAAREIIQALPLPLKDPATTAAWEGVLESIIEGRQSLDEFISMQSGFVLKMIDWAKNNTIEIDIKAHGDGGIRSGHGSHGSQRRQKSGGSRQILISVPFGEKEEAKLLGARWNGSSWYITESMDRNKFSRWTKKTTKKGLNP